MQVTIGVERKNQYDIKDTIRLNAHTEPAHTYMYMYIRKHYYIFTEYTMHTGCVKMKMTQCEMSVCTKCRCISNLKRQWALF